MDLCVYVWWLIEEGKSIVWSSIIGYRGDIGRDGSSIDRRIQQLLSLVPFTFHEKVNKSI